MNTIRRTLLDRKSKNKVYLSLDYVGRGICLRSYSIRAHKILFSINNHNQSYKIDNIKMFKHSSCRAVYKANDDKYVLIPMRNLLNGYVWDITKPSLENMSNYDNKVR